MFAVCLLTVVAFGVWDRGLSISESTVFACEVCGVLVAWEH